MSPIGRCTSRSIRLARRRCANAGPPFQTRRSQACLQCDAVLLGAVGDPAFDQVPPAERPEAGLLKLRRALGGFANLRPARTAKTTLVGATPYRPEKVARRRRPDRARAARRAVLRRAARTAPRRSLQHDALHARRGRSAWRTSPSSEARGRRRLRHLGRQGQRARDVAALAFDGDRGRARLPGRYARAHVRRRVRDATRARADPLRRASLTENLFGDILSDQAAALAGSIGMLPSATIGGTRRISTSRSTARRPTSPARIAPIRSAPSRRVAMLLRYTARSPARSVARRTVRFSSVLDIGPAPRGSRAGGHETVDHRRSR